MMTVSYKKLFKLLIDREVDIGDVMEIDPITKSEVKTTTEVLNKR